MSKYKRLFTDTLAFGVSNFGSKILTLLLVPLYTSVLSTSDYGTADFITTTVSLIFPILTLCICDATLRFAFEKEIDKNKILGVSLIFIGAVVGLLLLFSSFIRSIYEVLDNYWRYFISIFLVTSLQTCFGNYTKGIKKTKLFAVQGLILTAVMMICNIYFLLFAKIGLPGYLLSIIISYTVSVLFMIVMGKYHLILMKLSFDTKLAREMLVYSLPLVPTTVAWWVNASADKYMIISMVGLGASGLYSVAQKIPTILTVITSVFSQAWQISAISNYGNKDNSVFYSTIYKYYNILGLYACITIMFFVELAAKILFANEYYYAWKFVPPLLLSAMFSAYAGFLAAAFTSSKKTSILFTSTSIGAIVNIVLNYILINWIGTIGAAIATMISFMFVWAVRLITIQKVVPLEYSIPKMSVTYLLLIAGALYFSFDGVFKYLIFAVVSIIIIIVNLRDTKELLKIVLSLVNRKKHLPSYK